MRRQLVLFCFSFLFIHAVIGQPTQLLIKGYGKDLHIDHTVSPKEGIFSIGRLYNVHPKAIAAYNKLDITKGLSVGQVIHIPLTDTNFSQHSGKGRPLFYSVGAKETLEKVSNVNNKVSTQNLRDWNKLPNDNVKAGTKLIVGYLVSGEAATATAGIEKKEGLNKDSTVKQPVVKTTIVPDSALARNTQKKDTTKKAGKVVLKQPLPNKDSTAKQIVAKTNAKTDKAVQADKQKQTDAKKNEATSAKIPANDSVAKQQVVIANPDPGQVNNKEEERKEEAKKTESLAFKPVNLPENNGQGYFKHSFEQQIKTHPLAKTETVTAGIFKMMNGPQGAKYYVLVDGVPSGTIVKVINPENNKAIYAKVLGEMNGIRQNQGLNIRISNAAAANLNITDTDKFIVKINY